MPVVAKAPALTRDSGKEEEIHFLRWCAEQVAGKDLYLSSFFSPETIAEIEHRIRGDLDTDMHPYYQAYLRARTDLEQAVAQAQSEQAAVLQARDRRLGELEKQLEDLRRQLATVIADRDDLRERDERWVVKCNESESRLERLEQLAKDAWFEDRKLEPETVRRLLAD